MKKILTLGLLLVLTMNVYANERGNAGNSVVCRNEDGSIRSAELLDIYEGKVLFGLKYSTFKESLDKKYLSILAEIFGELSEMDLMYYKSVKESFTMLPAGVGLESSNDSFHIIIPNGCKIEQVANFYNPTKIYIVSDIYKKFSKLDKLGLLLHEVFYDKDRKGSHDNQSMNSRLVRRSVAHILSKGFEIEPILSEIDRTKDLFCTTDLDVLPDGKRSNVTSFYAKKLENNVWRFQFTRLNGHQMFSKKTAEIFFPENSFPLYPSESPRTGATRFQTTNISSKIDGYEPLLIGLSDGNRIDGKVYMSLSWNGFDPDDKLDNVHFNCIANR